MLCIVGTHCAKLKNKSRKLGADTSEPSQKSAIIAIQIIDPEEETDNKHSKRTIDSSLGYGYQNSIFGGKVSQPKYEVYKYSQHDIPPYNGPSHFKSSGFHERSYSQNGHTSGAAQQYYQPGTTLYSTINQNGHVGGLSSALPASVGGGHNNLAVPVIILRVLPSQLSSPANHLYPNLPQSNYFAPIVNTIDIKSLLSSYISNHNGNKAYSAPQYQPEVSYQQPVQYHQQNNYQNYQTQPQVQSYASHQAESPKQDSYSITKSHITHQIDETEYPSPGYAPQQYLPVQDNHVPTNQYLPAVQKQVPETQYLPVQEHQQVLDKQYLPAQEQVPDSQYLPVKSKLVGELLTHENYPAKTHTRVIFKTAEGDIKTSQQESPSYTQNNYAQEPTQDIDYQQYGEQQASSDYGDVNADYGEQHADPNQYVYDNNQHHEQASANSPNIIYVPAESEEESTDTDEKKS